MARDDQCFSSCSELQKELSHFDTGFGIQTVCRFIEDQNLWIVQERSSDSDSLLHAVTKALDVAVLHVGGARRFHDFLDASLALRSWDPKNRPEKVEVFMDTHVVIRSELVGHVADKPFDSRSVLAAIDPGDGGTAGGGF